MNVFALMVWLIASAGPGDQVEKEVRGAFRGWTVAEKASGDLNGDSVPDVAVTFQRPAPDKGEYGHYKAMLAVFFAGPDGKLRVHTRAPHAVCVGCGGMKDAGGVIGAPSINGKGILSITYEGGARVMWTITEKWRYDAKSDRFLLIGETREYSDTLSDDGEVEPGEETSVDINYLSGKMFRNIRKHGTLICDAKPRYAAIDLGRFDFQNDDDDRKFVKGSCKKQ